jgi:hypothetical protein
MTMTMTEPTMTEPLRIGEIAERLEESLLPTEPPHDRDLIRFAPPSARRLPLPDYLSHRDDVDHVGKAASEAIVIQYQGAIKALETMGKELIECVKEAHEMAERCIEAVNYITETCDLYRDESKLIFVRIEHASALTAEVRKLCDDMRAKIKQGGEPAPP